ncbi:MAG: TetR/AcrR family transcriptional regulator [Chryseolinea sp.]
MEFQVSFKVNAKIYLRDPESSDVGREIVKNGIDLINKLGFEHFTFKKLAGDIGCTEATIYRYFENKHRLLLYILNWYWNYMEFLVDFTLTNIKDNRERLSLIVRLLTHELPDSYGKFDYNKKSLNEIVIAESSKVYLVKDVSEINKDQVFKPYKDLCAKIATVISAYNPRYKYPKSLSTTLIETAHQQQYFSLNLPRLTDATPKNKGEFTGHFLEELLFKSLS